MEKNRAKKINSIIILSLGGLILIWIGLKIVFPSFIYTSAKTEKVERTKIFVVERKIDNKKYLTVAPLFDYPYHSIKLVIKNKAGLAGEGNTLKISKGYVAQFFPEGEAIDNESVLKNFLFEGNPTELPNGSLVSYNDTVFFVSRGKARAFIDPKVFTGLGFDWKNVISINGSQYAKLKAGEPVNFNSSHPDGTVLKDGDEKFMIWDQQRLRLLKGSLLESSWKEHYAVKVSQKKSGLVGNCQVKSNIFDDLVCKNKTEEHHFQGNSYLFELNEEVEEVEFSSVKLSMLGNFDLSVARESLARIKNALNIRYGEFVQ